MTRPRKDREARRELIVRVRFTASEKLDLVKLAENAGLSLSDLIRTRTTASKPQVRKATPDRAALIKLSAELNKVGSNVNQIARALNRRDDLGEQLGVDKGMIEYVLQQVKDLAGLLAKELGLNGDTR